MGYQSLPVQLLLSLHMPAAHNMGCILEDDSVSDSNYRQVVRELRSLALSSNSTGTSQATHQIRLTIAWPV